MLLKHHFINKKGHFDMFQPSKGSNSGSTTDTFQYQRQQNELPDVKLSLVGTV